MDTNVAESDAVRLMEHQAMQWLVRMDGDRPLTEMELKTLEDWLRLSALHPKALRRLAAFWSQANILTELLADTSLLTLLLSGRDRREIEYEYSRRFRHIQRLIRKPN